MGNQGTILNPAGRDTSWEEVERRRPVGKESNNKRRKETEILM